MSGCNTEEGVGSYTMCVKQWWCSECKAVYQCSPFMLYYIMIVIVCVCRAVRGSVVHGDAPGTFFPKRGRVLWPVHHLLGLCHTHSRHPAHHGGAVSLPARPASALVRDTHTHFIYVTEVMHTPHVTCRKLNRLSYAHTVSYYPSPLEPGISA